MSLNNDKENDIQVEFEFDKVNISDNGSNSVNINHKNCYEPPNKLWCKECVPRNIIEGWTSGNHDIDEFIKFTIYNARCNYSYGLTSIRSLEWVPYNKFTDIKQIGEGGFAKVYSATWIDGRSEYERQGVGSWKKENPEPNKEVALKRLNGSQNISAEYLNELKIHFDLYNLDGIALEIYGLTRDPETKEFMIIMQFAEKGNLRYSLSSNFKNILWKDKILSLYCLAKNLSDLHKLGYSHRDFHSGNILQLPGDISSDVSRISDFGLSGPADEQKSDNKVYGVLPYIAPEVLNGEQYTFSSDIYSVGIIMTELSSGKPPFYKRKHDANLALEICNGLRPEFGKGTPEIYKKLAYRCMNANPSQRPTAKELKDISLSWFYSTADSTTFQQEREELGHKGKEIRAAFEEADKKIPNISTLYEKDSGAIYTSRAFTFNNLSKPINSSIITSYIEENNKDCQDSQLINLEVTSSLQLSDISSDKNNADN